jgi:hypothetical protein
LLNRKTPFVSVTVARSYPVMALLIATSAPTVTAPDGSVTVPVTVPLLMVCAEQGKVARVPSIITSARMKSKAAASDFLHEANMDFLPEYQVAEWIQNEIVDFCES